MKRRVKKEALGIIQEQLDEGKPRKEILEELTKIYNDRSAIAELIAMTPDKKTKEKYSVLNYIVLCGLVISLGLSIYAAYLLFKEKPVESVIALCIVLWIMLYFIIEVAKFKGYIYNLITFLVIIGIIGDLTRISEFGKWDIIGIIVSLAFAGLTFFLSKKMFPNYGFFQLKKDNNGDYLLE
ncbi:MAG: hypothetical protein EHM47_15315 [Ignavibacteriales bacterium]|nr:MAG: hypothetical protein EHM47_15315 [Ignavibacteriales bacterium]